MKNRNKIIGKIVGLMAALGIILICVGVAMGGTKIVASDSADGKLFMRYSFGFDIGGITDGELFTDSEFSNMTSISEKNTFDSSEISDVVFEAEYGEFQIVARDNDYYEITSARAKDIEKIRYSFENGKLTVRIKGKKNVMIGDDVKATLYVPRNVAIEKFEINVGAGELNCEGISGINNLVVNIGAGEADFNNISAGNAEVQVGAGDGNIERAQFDNAEFNVGVGNLDVDGSISGDINIECGIGETDLNLRNAFSDYNYMVDVGLGEVTVANQKYTSTENGIVIDNGSDNNINVDCGIGEVNLNFD